VSTSEESTLKVAAMEIISQLTLSNIGNTSLSVILVENHETSRFFENLVALSNDHAEMFDKLSYLAWFRN
jgi:hypothetical protein